MSCTHVTASETEPAPAAAPLEDGELPVARAQLDGRDFPDGVLALTWDDGPDDDTLALAEYLHRERVSGTFFVVGAWTEGVSSDPGFGRRVYASGHERLPVLGDLVALGHRIGNHTLHHAMLGNTSGEVVEYELRENQKRIDPYIKNELRVFRAPGGYWSESASRAVDADSYLAQLVGPLRWDIDAKDWEDSVYCESAQPALECERAAVGAGKNGGSRVRAEVVARRYLEAIDGDGRGRLGHGVVLLHDRVGDVGSDYALEIAHLLVPHLLARGYVFAAPLLQLSPMTTRTRVEDAGEVRFGDVDGDGLADACTLNAAAGVVTCRLATWSERPADEDGTPLQGSHVPRIGFDGARVRRVAVPADASSFELADLDGDGRADVCAKTASGIACALANAEGFGAARLHRLPPNVGFGDIDGDGRSDACWIASESVVCARGEAGPGFSFAPAHVWLRGLPVADANVDLVLADVDGNGRANACVRAAGGIFCASSTRAAFAHWTKWSAELGSASRAVFGDLNGDGRTDVCGVIAGDLRCALSDGKTFTHATTWLQYAPDGALQAADINGDGRSDICTLLAGDERGRPVACAVAP